MSGRKDIDGLVAWCCSHYPTTCSGHGFTDHELTAWFATWDHYRLVHMWGTP